MENEDMNNIYDQLLETKSKVIYKFVIGEYEKPDRDKLLLLIKKHIDKSKHIRSINQLLEHPGGNNGHRQHHAAAGARYVYFLKLRQFSPGKSMLNPAEVRKQHEDGISNARTLIKKLHKVLP